MKISVKLAILIAIVAFGSTQLSHAQQAPKSKGTAHAAQPAATPATPQADTAPANAPAPPGWMPLRVLATRLGIRSDRLKVMKTQPSWG